MKDDRGECQIPGSRSSFVHAIAGGGRLVFGHRDEAIANRRIGRRRVRDLQRRAVGKICGRLDAQPAARVLAIGRVQHRRDQ